jgi:Carboxypeptidase regulatory-like domain
MVRAGAQDSPPSSQDVDQSGQSQQNQPQQDQSQPNQDQQNPPQPPQQAPLPAAPPPGVSSAPATLHGVVRNAVTGEGIPRALVQIEGDAQTGALTDGDGRFAIFGLRAGPVEVAVFKPGFFNTASQMESGPRRNGEPGPPQNVLVAAEMPDVEFTLAPTGSIRGRIDLSTGDPADGIEVVLVRRVVQDGRATWQWETGTKTRSDGAYRFGGLPDGQYELYTLPSLDGEAAALLSPEQARTAGRWGYPTVAWPGTRDYSDAQAIPVAHGADVQANFLLTRQPFERVTAQVTLPHGTAAESSGNFAVQVTDGNGRDLPYNARYDAKAHTVQAALPEGNYALTVTSNDLPAGFEGLQSDRPAIPGVLAGSVDFAVADHAVTGLRVPLSAPAQPRVDVTINRSGTGASPASNSQIAVNVDSAGGLIGGAMGTQLAAGPAGGPLQATSVQPGAYWVHTFLSGGGLCEQSFTAGGVNLGREPLTVGAGGAAVPLELTLRDDCAQLTLTLPENLAGFAAGVEPFYTVYAVPDFDYTSDVRPVVLRPSVSARATLDGLTPGNYHVYVIAGDSHLEYRNPAALASLAGQAVTLGPGATATLVLEAPGQ